VRSGTPDTTMFMIAKYRLERKEKDGVLVVVEEDPPPCPCCGGDLKYRDSRSRIRKKEGEAEDQHLLIPRYRCQNPNCKRYHNGLPDCLAPHKHYEAEVISGVCDRVVTEDDEDSEQFPCAATMRRWIMWLTGNIPNIDGHFRIKAERDERFFGLTYERIHQTTQRWLEVILRLIYNTGGVLPAQPDACT